jgi:glycosyltransferase involved in cell wall biosynthesis
MSDPPGAHAHASINIAHILPWRSIGGTEVATLRIAQAVRPFNVRSVAFCLEGANSVRDLFRESKIEAVEYEQLEPSYFRGLHFLRASWRLARLFRANRINVVHCADLMAGHNAAVAGKMARLSVICHIRNRFERISGRDRLFIAAVEKFVFVSAETWRKFDYPVSPQRGVVIYDGYQPCLSRSGEGDRTRAILGIDRTACVIGMVARIAPQKDHETFLNAAKVILAKRPATRFLIVGDHSSSETFRDHYRQVRRISDGTALESAVIFTDQQPNVQPFIEAMDIVVLSTHQEGLPLIILEAMALGKPVVATRVDGIPEVVEHGSSGLLVAPKNADEMATAILTLMDDPAKRLSLGNRGRQICESKFSPQRFATELHRLYSQAVGGANQTRQ